VVGVGLAVGLIGFGLADCVADFWLVMPARGICIGLLGWRLGMRRITVSWGGIFRSRMGIWDGLCGSIRKLPS